MSLLSCVCAFVCALRLLDLPGLCLGTWELPGPISVGANACEQMQLSPPVRAYSATVTLTGTTDNPKMALGDVQLRNGDKKLLRMLHTVVQGRETKSATFRIDPPITVASVRFCSWWGAGSRLDNITLRYQTSCDGT